MKSILLNIARIKIRIESLAEGLIKRYEEFYHHYILTDPFVEVDYEITIELRKFKVNLQDEGTFNFQGYAYKSDNERAILICSSLKNAYQYSEEFLLFIFSNLCIKKNMLVFHSAAILDNKGMANIFFGPSGVGKSTLSEKLSSMTVFSDDMIVIETFRGEYILHKTPFERNKTWKESKVVSIKGFYRLKQSNKLNKVSLSKSEALNALLSNIWFSEYQNETINEYMSFLSSLIENIPVSELHLTKDCYENEIVYYLN